MPFQPFQPPAQVPARMPVIPVHEATPPNPAYVKRWVVGALVVVAVVVIGLGLLLTTVSTPPPAADSAQRTITEQGAAPTARLTRVLPAPALPGIDVRGVLEGGKGYVAVTVTIALPGTKCHTLTTPVLRGLAHKGKPTAEWNILVWPGDCQGYTPTVNDEVRIVGTTYQNEEA